MIRYIHDDLESMDKPVYKTKVPENAQMQNSESCTPGVIVYNQTRL